MTPPAAEDTKVVIEDPPGPDAYSGEALPGWKLVVEEASLPESHSTVSVPPLTAPWWKKMWAFTGMGLIISVGYMVGVTAMSKRK
jgi:manganese transport protein